MEEKKPNVIPTKEQIEAANAANEAILAEESVKYNTEVSDAEAEAIRQMEAEALQQVEAIKNGEKIIRPDLVEAQKAVAVGVDNQDTNPTKPPIEKAKIEAKPKVDTPMDMQREAKPINVPYDLIPLPSEGKIYPHKKTHLKIAYLNASDENILSSPNLIESGKFMEVLLNRKILDEGIQLKDLHIGDRNAIMLWLRATGYGEMYPIVVYDEDNNPFEAEIDLSTLKIKKLAVEPDDEGLFDYYLEKSKKNIKFKFLTVGDIDEINELAEQEITELKLEYSNTVTHRLERMIVEVDGIRDRDAIKQFIAIMPAADSRALRNYYDEIEPNVDLRIQVPVPEYKDEKGEVRGGGLVETFLPININFFWPDF